MDFSLSIFWDSMPGLLEGAYLTVNLALVSLPLAICLGFILSVLATWGPSTLRLLILMMVTTFRGVPLILVLMILHYGLPSAGLTLSKFTSAVIALVVCSGAYISEVFRSSFKAVPYQQMDAALALGLNRRQAILLVIVPQSIRISLPPLTNEATTLLKNTSLVSVIALADLMRAGQEAMSWRSNVFSPFAGVALLYLMMTLPMIWLAASLERRRETFSRNLHMKEKVRWSVKK